MTFLILNNADTLHLKNLNRFIVIASLFLSTLLLTSCVTYRGNFTTNTIIKPVNVNPLYGRWVVDEPVLEKMDQYYETIVIDAYKKVLVNKFPSLKTIREFDDATSLKNNTENNLKTLNYYKEKTQFDYLIATKLNLIKVDNNNFTKELYIKIIVYNLNYKNKIFEKEYTFKDDFTGFNDNPFASRLDKFLKISINDCIKNFGKKENWKSVDDAQISR